MGVVESLFVLLTGLVVPFEQRSSSSPVLPFYVRTCGRNQERFFQEKKDGVLSIGSVTSSPKLVKILGEADQTKVV